MMKQKDPSEKVRSQEKDSIDNRCNSNNSDHKNASASKNYNYLNRQNKVSDKMQLRQMSGEVLHRARSTFSNISDVWRPRGSSSTRIKHKSNGHDDESMNFQRKMDFENTTFKNRRSQESNSNTFLQKSLSKQKCLSRHYSADAESTERHTFSGPFSGVKVLESEDVTAIERPRKKLSFRDPEIIGENFPCNETLPRRKTPCIVRSSSLDGLDIEQRIELESQAMRVVRTVGQAFEVCHKLVNKMDVGSLEPELSEAEQSFSGEERTQQEPTPEPAQDNEKDREDLLVSTDETPKTGQARDNRPKRLELPSLQTSLRRSPSTCEPSTLATPGLEKSTNMATQHELQLLREKLEQQTQQTQHAMSQLLMLRDQLAAESAARLEAQARTQQLLVHNRELLDHIAALVSHLHDVERTDQHVPCTSTPPRSPALIMPQLKPAAKVERWFSQSASAVDGVEGEILWRPESGFVSAEDADNSTTNLLTSVGKRKNLLTMDLLNKVTTF